MRHPLDPDRTDPEILRLEREGLEQLRREADERERQERDEREPARVERA